GQPAAARGPGQIRIRRLGPEPKAASALIELVKKRMEANPPEEAGEAEAEPKAEPEKAGLPMVLEVEPAEVDLFARASEWTERERTNGPLVMSRIDPFAVVQKWVTARAWRDGVPTVRFSQEMFWVWKGKHWVEVAEKQFRNAMWRHLAAAS